MKTAEIIEKLIELFDGPDKWTKNKLSDSRGTRFCVLGGIGKVCNGEPWGVEDTDVHKVARALRIKPSDNESYGDDELWNGLVEWNNSPETTYEKFMARLRQGLERAQSRYGHRA